MSQKKKKKKNSKDVSNHDGDESLESASEKARFDGSSDPEDTKPFSSKDLKDQPNVAFRRRGSDSSRGRSSNRLSSASCSDEQHLEREEPSTPELSLLGSIQDLPMESQERIFDKLKVSIGSREPKTPNESYPICLSMNMEKVMLTTISSKNIADLKANRKRLEISGVTSILHEQISDTKLGANREAIIREVEAAALASKPTVQIQGLLKS